jgi:hypothetical protein
VEERVMACKFQVSFLFESTGDGGSPRLAEGKDCCWLKNHPVSFVKLELHEVLC